ncbi:M28 family metallopeptidase [Sphingomicrobium clamense]|uniref:M28 family peptidase n=1 Tax=Sphingomicrobium clamense TaxID=2851013 RepID=A0ABS6V5Y5_9SPHN|nr:M28 family peptidase [Sphingomicrobium sp. B8]MBW0144975.1 M28 family peptidase [Sphingomicrobium sp. B8]
MTKFAALLAASAVIAVPAWADPVEEAEIREVLEVLASDEFEGREPGTEGGRKTLHYLATQWAEAGLVGGARDGGWYEPVILVSSKPTVSPVAARDGDKPVELAGRSALIVGGSEPTALSDVPIVYGGYGVTPEGAPLPDIAGKLVPMLAGPAPFEGISPANNNPLGRAMGLLGAGANAVLAILPSGMPFDGIVAQMSGGQPRLEGTSGGGGGMPDGAVIGVANDAFVDAIAQHAGSDGAQWAEAAATEDFSAVDTGLVTDIEAAASAPSRSVYFNVVGKLPGTDPSLGAIAVGGHWDGYGICRPEGAEDRICNGAVDNASGLAAMTAFADDLVEDGPYLRDILVVGFTMEEKGLWGARGMAANPPQDIDLLFNIDTIATTDNTDRVAVIGRGVFAMDEEVLAAVEPHGYTLNDTQKYSNRQDGHAFVQAGIPAYVVSVNWGDMENFDRYVDEGPYHQPGDDMSEVRLGATVADANLNLALLQHFADKAALPEGKSEE